MNYRFEIDHWGKLLVDGEMLGYWFDDSIPFEAIPHPPDRKLVQLWDYANRVAKTVERDVFFIEAVRPEGQSKGVLHAFISLYMGAVSRHVGKRWGTPESKIAAIARDVMRELAREGFESFTRMIGGKYIDVGVETDDLDELKEALLVLRSYLFVPGLEEAVMKKPGGGG